MCVGSVALTVLAAVVGLVEAQIPAVSPVPEFAASEVEPT